MTSPTGRLRDEARNLQRETAALRTKMDSLEIKVDQLLKLLGITPPTEDEVDRALGSWRTSPPRA